MKKLTNLLIVCSLALAGAVMAQEPTPEESQAPGKKPEKKAPAEVKPKGPQAPKTEAPKTEAPKTEAPAMKEAPAKELPSTTKPEKAEKPEKPDKKAPPTKPAPETKAPAPTEQPAATMTPAPKKEKPPKSTKDMTKSPSATPAMAATATPATAKATATPAVTTASATPATTTASATPATTTASPTPAAAASATPAAGATTTPATTASASVAPSVSQSSQTTAVNPTAVKKLEVQKVEQIRQKHATFRAQPRPERVPAVTFSASYRIQGSDQWQGPRYEVYRSYRPERHDQGWYRSKYQRVELIAGGYYYFHNNYWYPAWGYNPTNEYYAYDAPIYVGKTAEPPDKVIANVQAVLQEMGYYKGEVDGLLGPLTRQALTGYQTDNGMTVTAVIDEPTLDALGMG